MDPNETLRQIRAELAEYHATEMGEGDAIGALERIAELIEALDEWLSRDGFLPDDWRSDDEKAGKA